MGTDVITNLAGSLDAELEKARETLRGVDDSIKKLFGKDASELNFSGGGRNRRNNLPVNPNHENLEYEEQPKHYSNRRGREKDPQDGRRPDHNTYGGFGEEEPMEKRRRFENSAPQTFRPPNAPLVIGPRFKPRYNDDEPPERVGQGPPLGDRIGRRLQSRIVTSTKEKSREEVLAEQRDDRKGRDRNRRMFGALLGTLQRFKQEETQLKDKEEKRAQIEAKLDEAAKQERESVKMEKQQLIKDRKFKLTEIKRLELKRRRIAELEQWEAKTKYLTNFIRTEAKPPIFYKPKIMTPIMECRLEQSKQVVTEMIASKRKLVLEDLESYEEKSKRYWERRLDGHDFRRAEVHPMDQDIEDELKELMKNEELAEVTEVTTEAEDFTVTVYQSPEKPIKMEAEASGGEDFVDSTVKEEIETTVIDGENENDESEPLGEDAEDRNGEEEKPMKSEKNDDAEVEEEEGFSPSHT